MIWEIEIKDRFECFEVVVSLSEKVSIDWIRDVPGAACLEDGWDGCVLKIEEDHCDGTWIKRLTLLLYDIESVAYHELQIYKITCNFAC